MNNEIVRRQDTAVKDTTPAKAGRDTFQPPTLALTPGNIAAYVDIQHNRRWRSQPHAHEGFEFIYMIRGRKKIFLNGMAQSYRAAAGDLVVFRPGDVHEEFSDSHTLIRMVIRCHPQDMAAAAVTFPPRDKLGPVTALPWKEKFQNLFTRMCTEKAQPQAGSDILLAAYLMEFVVLLSRAAEAVPPRDEEENAHHRVRAVVELINENMSSAMSLREMAKTAFMSVSHFAHLFKAQTGEAPKHYLIEAKLKQAKDLLRTSSLSIQEIARQLGYENPYYFYRLFRKRVGMTAGAYRRKAKLCIAKR